MWCTSDMKPSLQVQKAVTKAMQTLGMLKRPFKLLSRDLFLFLYRTYIRPHLEYLMPSYFSVRFNLAIFEFEDLAFSILAILSLHGNILTAV